MPVNVQNFQVDEIVVHDVPKHSDLSADEAIKFSEAAIPNIDAQRRNYFRERIAISLASGRAHHVVRDPDQSSDVPQLIAFILERPEDLVEASQDLARALYAAQNRINNPGLLTVITGRVDQERCVSILKLQRQTGLRMQQITDDQGRRTYSSAIFDDLTLNDDTRVFKASVFRTDEPANADGIEGLVSDDQRHADAHVEVSQFFLSRFLGCKLKEEADVATKRLHRVSREFFRTLDNPALELEYRAALTAELLRPSQTISPTEFAERHLRVDDRQRYLDYLGERGVAELAVDKDTHLIDQLLRRIIVKTGHGIRISGPPDVLNQRVTIEPATETTPGRIVIADLPEEFS
ncbi:MAG: nucleoid-associated protein [Solirubrobacteraceae bacterium]